MIIDFRYHVASLVAVFLALGIGILIGGAALGTPALQKELSQIEESLAKMRNDQRTLQAEITKRDTELKVYTEFGSAVVPVLVKDKLLGKRVALIRTNPSTDPRLVKDLARLFGTAGAKIVSSTTILCDPASLAAEKIEELQAKLNLTASDPAAFGRQILQLLADRIANGPAGTPMDNILLPSLANSRIVETSGSYLEMVDILVLIGGSRNPALDMSQQVDRVLIDAVAETKGLLVAAVETSTVEDSYLPEYLQHPIIVVDDIEMAAGQTALIMALVRGKKGHYGVNGAHQLLPEIL